MGAPSTGIMTTFCARPDTRLTEMVGSQLSVIHMSATLGGVNKITFIASVVYTAP